MYKALFIILDGLGDHVYKGRTPLEAATKPNIDRLCREGENGVVSTVARGVVPGSDTGHLGLFGYDPYKYYPGRGTFEALGAGIELEGGELCFRVNFGTVKGNVIIDRRAGRNDYGIERLLEDFKEKIEEIEKEYNVKIILKHTVEHRGVLIIKGNVSDRITENDIHKAGIPVRKIEPLDESARETAEILNKLIEEFYKFAEGHPVNKERENKGIPPANYILIRGKSIYRPLPENEKYYNRYGIRGMFIAGASMYLGVAKYVGLDVYKPIGATGTVNTSLFSKAEAAITYRDKYDIVYIHVKATDSLSHDRKPEEKKRFIERIDEQLVGRLKDEFDIIVITGDHSTSSILGRHTSDPVPILLHSPIGRKDPVKKFTERKCYRGILGHLIGTDVIKILLDRMGKEIMFGS